MNPKEFPWDESQQVTVTNPTEKDYRFKVHNKEHEVKAGHVVKMPGFIAWVYVYGMACQKAQEDNVFNRWNEEGFRQTYFDKFVIGADDVIQEVQPETSPIEDVNEPPTSEPEDSMPKVKRGRPAKSE